MNASDLVAAYDKLIARANDIAGCYVCEPHMARISFEGADAVISWPEAQGGYYDSCSIETQKTRFPARLLDAPENEVEYYKAEKKRLAAEASARFQIQRAKEQEARELSMLSALQQKYGNRS